MPRSAFFEKVIREGSREPPNRLFERVLREANKERLLGSLSVFAADILDTLNNLGSSKEANEKDFAIVPSRIPEPRMTDFESLSQSFKTKTGIRFVLYYIK